MKTTSFANGWNVKKKIFRSIFEMTISNDSQLQMIFSVCHQAISKDSENALASRILCGFGIDEFTTAFLTTKETINTCKHATR